MSLFCVLKYLGGKLHIAAKNIVILGVGILANWAYIEILAVRRIPTHQHRQGQRGQDRSQDQVGFGSERFDRIRSAARARYNRS